MWNGLRCQYVIFVGSNCKLFVKDEFKKMEDNKIIVFDDSKIHYAKNYGEKDRIILILDIIRPKNIKKGESSVLETDDLINYVDSLR